MTEQYVRIKSDHEVGAGGYHERLVGMDESGRLFMLTPEKEEIANLPFKLFSSGNRDIEFRLPVGRDLTVDYETPLECEGGMVVAACGKLDNGGGCALNLRTITYQGQEPRIFKAEGEGVFYIGIIPGIQITDTVTGAPLFSLPQNPQPRQNKAG